MLIVKRTVSEAGDAVDRLCNVISILIGPGIAGTASVLAKSRPQKNFSGDNSRPQKHECLFMRGGRINISLATIHDTRFFCNEKRSLGG